MLICIIIGVDVKVYIGCCWWVVVFVWCVGFDVCCVVVLYYGLKFEILNYVDVEKFYILYFLFGWCILEYFFFFLGFNFVRFVIFWDILVLDV